MIVIMTMMIKIIILIAVIMIMINSPFQPGDFSIGFYHWIFSSG